MPPESDAFGSMSLDVGDGLEVVGRQGIEELLDPLTLIDRLAEGFIALSRGEVVAPSRIQLSTAQGYSLSMPAYRPGGPIMVKVVNVFERNAELGLPTHNAVICLFAAESGTCISILDGTAITNIRTAAAAALSVRLLARADATTLAIVGAGAQARQHLALVPLVRDVSEIRIASRRPAHAEALAALDPRATAFASSEEAVRPADIVCLCTSSGSPVVAHNWIAAGTHVTSVGYHEPHGELPDDLLDRARLFVETRLAFGPSPSGCFELAGRDPDSGTEIGELLEGQKPGRTSGEEITVYKSMGHAIEDLIAAQLVLERIAGAAVPIA
jgi:ornithine cyclodeaminase/alanine dehydrogenase-like protein (mu-crystallin family)